MPGIILGKITGKITTNAFMFNIQEETRKFEYIQVYHGRYGFVLCQVVEIEFNNGSKLAKCKILGYKDDHGKVQRIKIPFELDQEVLRADDSFIASIIELEKKDEKGAYVGKLEGKDISVWLNLQKLLTKHLAVLAKSGSGKSYFVGVLLEEILSKGVPLVVIDPHGEYNGLARANDDMKETAVLRGTYGIEPHGFPEKVQEFGDERVDENMRPLRLNAKLNGAEITHLMPGKLSAAQQGVLYNALRAVENTDFDSLLLELDNDESNAKYGIMSMIEYLRDLNIFSLVPTANNELVKSGKCSIINLKGIDPAVQEIIVYKLCTDLFEARKQDKIPPFFLVIEEAHNFCPERSYGETKCSRVIRTIASEGRKFGLGLAVVTQRPARIDKSVISQCSTQVILKVTNPNDLRAIAASVEGITAESEAEIQNLGIGTALITGVVDMPLFVNIRPRMTRHGGVAVDMLNQHSMQKHKASQEEAKKQEFPKRDVQEDDVEEIYEEERGVEPRQEEQEQKQEQEEQFFVELDKFEEKKMLPLIKPSITEKDIRLMSERPVKHIKKVLIPAYQFICKDDEQEYVLLGDLSDRKGALVVNVDTYAVKYLPELEQLTKHEIKILQAAYNMKDFTSSDIIQRVGAGIDVLQLLNSLVVRGYLVKEQHIFNISGHFILTKLSSVADHNKIVFESCATQEQLEQRINADVMKEKLSKFTSVIDQNECFILQYIVEYED